MLKKYVVADSPLGMKIIVCFCNSKKKKGKVGLNYFFLSFSFSKKPRCFMSYVLCLRSFRDVVFISKEYGNADLNFLIIYFFFFKKKHVLCLLPYLEIYFAVCRIPCTWKRGTVCSFSSGGAARRKTCGTNGA